ncbi:hypothetical protein R3P38DRAFT_2446586, partial [Favolaschia claudopus]
MHRCWDVVELTRLVFDEIMALDPAMRMIGRPAARASVTTGGPTAATRTLCRLARTCRKFSELALDVLWAEQSGYIPLLSTLPATTWSTRNGEFKIVTDLRQEDWERTLNYSRRIKQFRDVNSLPGLHNSAVEAVILSLPPGSLLPNVHYLSCQSGSPFFPHLSTILGTQISKIHIELASYQWRYPAVQHIALRCPFVKDFGLEGSFGNEDITLEWSSRFVLQMTQLRSVDVVGLNRAAWHHISRLAGLEKISSHSLIADVFTPSDESLLHPLFPVLRTLALDRVDLTLVAPFLSAFHSAPLQTLMLSGRNLESVRTLNVSIATHCSPLHLTFLVIEICETEDDPPSLSFEDLRPLLRVPNLRNVRLLYPGDSLLNDEFVDEIANPWPALEELSMPGSPAFQDPPTLRSLLSFARHCPHLRSLELDVDAKTIPLD